MAETAEQKKLREALLNKVNPNIASYIGQVVESGKGGVPLYEALPNTTNTGVAEVILTDDNTKKYMRITLDGKTFNVFAKSKQYNIMQDTAEGNVKIDYSFFRPIPISDEEREAVLFGFSDEIRLKALQNHALALARGELRIYAVHIH